jgi:activating signal cointegrator complex subunit 1
MLFMDAGLLVADERPLRLHATVVNTVYAKEKGRGRGGKGAVKVDARGMVERWGEVVWAKDVMIERVGICRMGARRVEGVGEEYEEVVGMEI